MVVSWIGCADALDHSALRRRGLALDLDGRKAAAGRDPGLLDAGGDNSTLGHPQLADLAPSDRDRNLPRIQPLCRLSSPIDGDFHIRSVLGPLVHPGRPDPRRNWYPKGDSVYPTGPCALSVSSAPPYRVLF